MSVGAKGVKKAFLAREEAEDWMREGREASFSFLLLLVVLVVLVGGGGALSSGIFLSRMEDRLSYDINR